MLNGPEIKATNWQFTNQVFLDSMANGWFAPYFPLLTGEWLR